jgi:hypothetical protein
MGVLRMPVDDHSDLSLVQFIGRAREAAERIEMDAARLAELEANIERLVAANDGANQKNRELIAYVASLNARLNNAEDLHPATWAVRGMKLLAASPETSLARHDVEMLSKPFTNIKGCGEHGCLIDPPEGMGTNGGCRCHLDRTKASIIVQRLAQFCDAARRQAEV